jgi:hypothetical protein
VGAAKLGVVIVVVVVRTSPDAAGREGEDAKDAHQRLGHTGVGQDRVMLLIVVKHKEPENQQPAEKTANNPGGQVEIPESPCYGRRQEQTGGDHVEPTLCSGIRRKRLGR